MMARCKQRPLLANQSKVLTSTNPDSLEGAWLNVNLKPGCRMADRGKLSAAYYAN